MEILKLEMTNNTPSILMDHTHHLMEFNGDSRPEDVQKFYTPILEWLEEYNKYLYYLKDNQAGEISITCNFKFEYFNSSSAKYLMDIISKLNDISEVDGVALKLNWFYDVLDEDMLEAGQEFQDMLDISFNMIPIE